MKRVFRELLFSQLTLVEVIDKQTDSTLQGIRTTRIEGITIILVGFRGMIYDSLHKLL
ncbi:MAG: hypothetical protein HY022_08235 [Chloroflexi bacterium]|nr:hypothetical protein [Chloroflexota bacterium]